ncbi:hypothetical protein Tco_1225876 [Tanacetum coccineum]
MMMNHTLSKMEATSSGPLPKEATKTQKGQSKRKFAKAKDKNPSQPLASTHVVTELHKEALQATSGPTSLGVTGEERAGPQLSSVESTSQSKPVYSVFTIVYFQSASGHDASSAFTDEADLGKSAPKNSLSQPQGAEAIDLNSPKDDQPLQISSDDEADIQKYKLEKETVVAEATLLKVQPSFPNVQQLIELLVNSLKPELDKMLTVHDFSSSILMELKELPTQVDVINRSLDELKRYVEKPEIELPGDLKELPKNCKNFNPLSQLSQPSSQLTKLKVLDAIPSMLGKVDDAMDRFANAINSSSQKAGDQGVPSEGQAEAHPAKGEKNTT